MTSHDADALILLAHGSQHSLANREVAALAASVADNDGSQIVTHAFLGVTPPTLQEAVDQVVDAGATRVDVLPLFLNSGHHVTKDVPQLLDELRCSHPHITLRQLRHIGASQQFHSLVESLADNRALRESVSHTLRGA